jgi:cellulose synthase/poly-beta-1,6-N-acetylglucosamine synthase-like glycosyltransferase
VLTAPNGGQAAALNRGLAVTDAEIVVRIDGDCVMGPDALVYAVPWFRDPRIGCVGGMEEPRADTVTWFHRMRTLEALFQFRFARLGQSLVDGIAVIPGTFCAFRRRPAEEAGGYPMGMNGEDSDLTMQIGRLGYRVVADPRIRTYEDVPGSIGEFVEQRTRIPGMACRPADRRRCSDIREL